MVISFLEQASSNKVAKKNKITLQVTIIAVNDANLWQGPSNDSLRTPLLVVIIVIFHTIYFFDPRSDSRKCYFTSNNDNKKRTRNCLRYSSRYSKNSRIFYYDHSWALLKNRPHKSYKIKNIFHTSSSDLG